jgi:hypothetical protein
MVVAARLRPHQGAVCVSDVVENDRQPGIESFQFDLEDSIALSLGLTSYVDVSGEPSEMICEPGQPRGGLAQLIFAWENDDRSRLEAHLGTNAATALSTLLKDKGWEGMRHELWRDGSGRGAAVGFRFEAPGLWAELSTEPYETLEGGDDSQRPAATATPMTLFVEIDG